MRQFTERSERLYTRSIEKVRLAATQEMLIQVLTRSAPMVVVWVGASMIMSGTMTLGTLLAFLYLSWLPLPAAGAIGAALRAVVSLRWRRSNASSPFSI